MRKLHLNFHNFWSVFAISKNSPKSQIKVSISNQIQPLDLDPAAVGAYPFALLTRSNRGRPIRFERPRSCGRYNSQPRPSPCVADRWGPLPYRRPPHASACAARDCLTCPRQRLDRCWSLPRPYLSFPSSSLLPFSHSFELKPSEPLLHFGQEHRLRRQLVPVTPGPPATPSPLAVELLGKEHPPFWRNHRRSPRACLLPQPRPPPPPSAPLLLRRLSFRFLSPRVPPGLPLPPRTTHVLSFPPQVAVIGDPLCSAAGPRRWTPPATLRFLRLLQRAPGPPGMLEHPLVSLIFA